MGRENPDFCATLAVKQPGFEETQQFPRVPRGESMRTRYYPMALSPREDRSCWIIVGVVAAFLVIAALPQFKFFQNWTHITGWIQFLRNYFG